MVGKDSLTYLLVAKEGARDLRVRISINNSNNFQVEEEDSIKEGEETLVGQVDASKCQCQDKVRVRVVNSPKWTHQISQL